MSVCTSLLGTQPRPLPLTVAAGWPGQTPPIPPSLNSHTGPPSTGKVCSPGESAARQHSGYWKSKKYEALVLAWGLGFELSCERYCDFRFCTPCFLLGICSTEILAKAR